jgi:hypothetical protein
MFPAKLLSAVAIVSLTGCASLLAGLVKVAAPAAQSTTTLTDVVVTGGIETNLPPAELGTISQSFFSGWKTGGDQLVLMFTKKNGAGFYRIDGTVTVDGKPAEYAVIGTYSVITDSNASPRKVEIVTSTGERASFVMEPSKSRFEVLSVNGEKDKAPLDLTKDVVVELGAGQMPEGALLKVSLAMNQIGVKSFYEVCHVRYAPKLTIPAAAFRNINIKPGADALFNYSGSYLLFEAESAETPTDVTGALAEIRYTRAYADGTFVDVATEPELNPGLTVTGNAENMDYQVFKPSAFLSRPSDQITKLGVISFSVRGTTFHQSSTSNTTSNTLVMGGIANTTTTTTTTITTLEFPQQTDATWDALMEDLYPDFVGVLTSVFKAEEVPVDTITGTDAYSLTQGFAKDDENTKVEFARSFRNTKVLSAFMPVSEGYGANGVNQKIMTQSGADALVTLTLDLQVAQSQDEKVLMMPKLAFEIAGKANGVNTSTKFLAGTVVSTTGVPFSREITPDQLKAIVRKSDLLKIFRQALTEMKDKEHANNDYVAVWNLQK